LDSVLETARTAAGRLVGGNTSALDSVHTRGMPAKKRAVYLNADLHKALTSKSAAMDLTVAELVSKATRAYLADAADEATFGRQEPSLSFRGGGKKGAKKNAKKGARAKASGKKGATKGGKKSSKKRRG
jgi:hypothetical protein